VTLQDFSSALVLDSQHAQLWLRSLAIATDSLEADLEGEANLQAFQHPWPGSIDLDAKVNGLRPAAPVCFRQMLPTLPVAQDEQDKLASLFTGLLGTHC